MSGNKPGRKDDRHWRHAAGGSVVGHQYGENYRAAERAYGPSPVIIVFAGRKEACIGGADKSVLIWTLENDVTKPDANSKRSEP